MKLVVFGLSVSSAWGNGHATLWRALLSALTKRGHQVAFFERDVPYYAAHRDLSELESGELLLYSDWNEARSAAARHVAEADVAIVTSYCPDAVAASELVLSARRARRVFYDLDTPVTLAELREHGSVPYIGPDGLAPFDLVLSYTGGGALELLRRELGARRVAALYGSVDPLAHAPGLRHDRYRCDLSYLGTYAADRQPRLERLFLDPARRAPERRFLIGGAQYPAEFPWEPNIYFVRHVAPSEHRALFASSRATLNVTRPAMASLGHCPSGRLFEAAACGAAIITDDWPGLSTFFSPGSELLVAHDHEDVLDALALSDTELARIGAAARERALCNHTADARAAQLETLLEA